MPPLSPLAHEACGGPVWAGRCTRCVNNNTSVKTPTIQFVTYAPRGSLSCTLACVLTYTLCVLDHRILNIFVALAEGVKFSRSLDSCRRSYDRRSLSNINNVLHVSKHNPRPHPYYTEKGTFVKSLSAFFLHFFFVLIISASLQYRAFSSKRGRAIGRRVPWKDAAS